MNGDAIRRLADEWDQRESRLKTLEGNHQALLVDNLRLKNEIAGQYSANARLRVQLAMLEEKLAAKPDPETLSAQIICRDSLEDIPSPSRGFVVDAPAAALSKLPLNQGTGVYLYPGQLNKQGKAKAEFGPVLGEKAERYGRIPFGVERWHALTITLPADWKRDGNKVPMIEFHGSEDREEKGIGRNASISIFVVGDDWVGWRLWSDKKIQVGNENRVEAFRFPYTRTGPTRFIIRTVFDWQPGGSGLTEIWVVEGLNVRRSIFAELGPNAYNDAEGPYFKCGLYYPIANAPAPWPEGVPAKSAAFSNLVIAGPGVRMDDLL